MGRLAVIVSVSLLMLWGLYWLLRQFNPFEDMKAGVIQTSVPQSVAVARGACPIPLPDSATNIQYAVWSLWQASQTFVRFEAPVLDCLEHAETVLQPYAKPILQTNAVGPLAAPFVLSSKDLNVAWFDLPKFSAGISFQVTNRNSPTIWVDTNRGCFYYELND